MQTRDDVEAGDEKIKELESEMREIGLYDTDFSLGDILLEEAEEEGENNKPGGETRKKKKLDDFPSVEGEESLVEYIGQYKKACLNRKALLKSSKERLEKDNAKDYQTFGCTATYSNFFWGVARTFVEELRSPNFGCIPSPVIYAVCISSKE